MSQRLITKLTDRLMSLSFNLVMRPYSRIDYDFVRVSQEFSPCTLYEYAGNYIFMLNLVTILSYPIYRFLRQDIGVMKRFKAHSIFTDTLVI